MKKLICYFIVFAVSSLALVGCGNSTTEIAQGETTTLTVGATSIPHGEILNIIVDDLAEQGIRLEVKEFSDYKLLNPTLTDGSIDANFFQHIPYLEEYVSNSGDDLVSIGGVHIEPMGIYSEKISDLSELSNGDKVAVPNDSTNEARALLLLEEQGLIKLDENSGLLATIGDITYNPKNLEFVELSAAQLPRTLSEVTISIINTNYALEADLNPVEDSLAMESVNSPYVNVIVTTREKANDDTIQALYAAITSDKVREFIENNYNGSIVAVFE